VRSISRIDAEFRALVKRENQEGDDFDRGFIRGALHALAWALQREDWLSPTEAMDELGEIEGIMSPLMGGGFIAPAIDTSDPLDGPAVFGPTPEQVDAEERARRRR